jgi:hypothetical protein
MQARAGVPVLFLRPHAALALNARPLLIRKANGSGNPNHDPKTGEFAHVGGLPSSASISTLAEAQRYYREHIHGVWSLTIKRKAGIFRVRVDFTHNANHAYAKDVGDQLRAFEPKRARLMQHIIGAITNPSKILMNGNRDLFVEKRIAGNHYVVVLEWRPDSREYRFLSAHYWGEAEFNDNKARYGLPPARGAKVQKIEPPKRLGKSFIGGSTAFPSLRGTPEGNRSWSASSRFRPGGAPPRGGSCWPPEIPTMRYMADLVKAKSGDASWRDITADWRCEHAALTKRAPIPLVFIRLNGA